MENENPRNYEMNPTDLKIEDDAIMRYIYNENPNLDPDELEATLFFSWNSSAPMGHDPLRLENLGHNLDPSGLLGSDAVTELVRSEEFSTARNASPVVFIDANNNDTTANPEVPETIKNITTEEEVVTGTHDPVPGTGQLLPDEFPPVPVKCEFLDTSPASGAGSIMYLPINGQIVSGIIVGNVVHQSVSTSGTKLDQSSTEPGTNIQYQVPNPALEPSSSSSSLYRPAVELLSEGQDVWCSYCPPTPTDFQYSQLFYRMIGESGSSTMVDASVPQEQRQTPLPLQQPDNSQFDQKLETSEIVIVDDNFENNSKRSYKRKLVTPVDKDFDGLVVKNKTPKFGAPRILANGEQTLGQWYNTEDGRVGCVICDKKCSSLRYFKQHYKLHHVMARAKPEKVHQCPKCSVKFYYKKSPNKD